MRFIQINVLLLHHPTQHKMKQCVNMQWFGKMKFDSRMDGHQINSGTLPANYLHRFRIKKNQHLF